MNRFSMAQVIVLLVLVSFGISGCIGFKPFPLAARPGDTISLALGGSPVHETTPGQQITKNDLSITIEQDKDGNGVIDTNETFPVKLRYLFRLYPDLTSRAANFNIMNKEPAGEWIAIVNLSDPATGSSLALNQGPATLKVNSAKLKNNYYNMFEGNLQNIPIDILSGTGQSHTFNNIVNGSNNFYNVNELQPLPQLNISLSGTGNIAAASLDIDYDETILPNENYIKVRPYLNDLNVILNQRIYDDNGNWKMKIMLMTNDGSRLPEEMKCFIVWDPTYKAGTIITDTFNVTSAKFYDEIGAEVTGISVVKNLLYQ